MPGADVLVTLDRFGNLVRVFSKYVMSLVPMLRDKSSLEEVFSSVDYALVRENINSYFNRTDIYFIDRMEVIYVDRKSQSTVGIPALHYSVKIGNQLIYDVLSDALNGDIINVRKRNVSSNAAQINWTEVSYIIISTFTCTDNSDCPFFTFCSEDAGGRCVYDCVNDEECDSFRSGWECFVCEQGQICNFEKYCHKSNGSSAIKFYDENGYTQTDFSYIVRFSDLVTKMSQLISFHKDDLGRNSWSGGGHDYKTTLTDCCDWEDQGCKKYNEGCRGLAGADGSQVHYYQWSILGSSVCEQDLDCPVEMICVDNICNKLARMSSVYYTLSHEWAHNIIYKECRNHMLPDDECQNEFIPDMYGSFFSSKHVGDSSVRFPSSCGGARYFKNPWYDEISGLSRGGCKPIPYAHRSRFDWLECDWNMTYWWSDYCFSDNDCRPYEFCNKFSESSFYRCWDGTNWGDNCYPPFYYCTAGQTCTEYSLYWKRCTNKGDAHNNGEIWNRFVRVLSEGSSTFENDGNNENIGIEFDGIRWEKAVDIAYEATVNISSTMSLETWISLLRSAGNDHGEYSTVKKALGVVGFIQHAPAPYEAISNRAPSSYYFNSWSYSYKYFYIWKSWNPWLGLPFDQIKVYYHDATGSKTDTINANTDISPAVVEYNNRLYVFWRNVYTGVVEFIYYRDDGERYPSSGFFSLEDYNIKTKGAFDAVVWNDNLYLVYVSLEDDVMLSKCTYTTCNPAYGFAWYDYGDSSYGHNLGWRAYPGIGADVASFLNGTGWDTSLYIASSRKLRGTNYDKKIRIDKVVINDVFNDVEYSEHITYIPDHYPSFMTREEIGVKAVAAAFPSATTYLYLAWKDLQSTKVFTAVVQKYNGTTDPDNRTNTWITRSVDALLDETNTGVRLQKGEGPFVDRVIYTHTDSGFRIKKSVLFGRY